MSLLKRDYFSIDGDWNGLCSFIQTQRRSCFCVGGRISDIRKSPITSCQHSYDRLIVSAKSEKVGRAFALFICVFHTKIQIHQRSHAKPLSRENDPGKSDVVTTPDGHPSRLRASV